MSKLIRSQQRYLREENKKYGPRMVEVPESRWEYSSEYKPIEVWRSATHLVQVFPEQYGASRMSVCRTMMGEDGRWLDGITWEDLMRIKDECGYGRDWAVEIFPPTANVVNVANMRHLWLVSQAPWFAWRRT